MLELIREAREIARKGRPGLAIDGELQMDAAISPEAAQRKCPDSPLKGNANILVFPNLTASNIFGHGMMQFSSLEILGSFLIGLAKPVQIIGRSTPLAMVKKAIVNCAMQANGGNHA